jgi:hypothetical protein
MSSDSEKTIRSAAPVGDEGAAQTTRSPGLDKEGWHERAAWKPSRDEFEAYFVREVEMAKVTLSRTTEKNPTTLFSSTTIALALEALEKERNGT